MTIQKQTKLPDENDRQYKTDIKQSGSTLLQTDATVIIGAVVFLTISSIKTSISWVLSGVTAEAITPFVASAAYTLLAMYSWREDDPKSDSKRLIYLHNAFRSTLIGFLFIPIFIIVIGLLGYYANVTQESINIVLIGALLVGAGMTVLVAVFARKGGKRKRNR